MNIERFRIEPKRRFFKTWLEVFDTKSQDYLKQKYGNKNLRFKDSDEVLEFLKKKTLEEYKVEEELLEDVLKAFEEIGCNDPSSDLIQACLKELEYEKTITPQVMRSVASDLLYPTL